MLIVAQLHRNTKNQICVQISNKIENTIFWFIKKDFFLRKFNNE